MDNQRPYFVDGISGGPAGGQATWAIDRYGNALLGGAVSVTGAFSVAGALTVAGTITPTGVILAPNGSDTAPSYSFVNQPTLGFFRNGTDTLRFSVAAGQVVQFGALSILPTADNGYQLGASTNRWSNVVTVLLTIPGGTTPVLTTAAAITTGAGAQTATLTNSPTAGNPTKWVPINDNGTTRYFPAW